MSKVGKKPIAVPDGVTVALETSFVSVAGKLGTIRVPLLPRIRVEHKDGELSVAATGGDKQALANWGTMRAHLGNAVTGVRSGFSKVLEIEGVGYRAALEGNIISLSLGYAHPVKFSVPEGVTVTIEKNTTIRFFGVSKELVGQTAAKVRALKKPEPYKGKGIRYQDEVIRRKAGKKVATAAA